MSVVRLMAKPKKVTVSDLIKNLVGEVEAPPTEREIALCEEMEDLADQHGGDFDGEECCVIFEGKDSRVTVFASVDNDDNVIFQALHQQFKPNVFTSGPIMATFKGALESLKIG